jgi:ribosomal protein S18 acetylase RimI-like enzyme
MTCTPVVAPPVEGDLVGLRDGSGALIRPVRASDAALLVDGFERLSPYSRRMRFLMGKSVLSAKEVRYLTDVDHHHHEALGALDAATGRGVGVARYVRSSDDHRLADVAVAVVDEWQGRGLGTELMARLADRAQDEGIRSFSALVAADNGAAVALLRRMDADVDLIAYETDTVQYEISLRPRPRRRAAPSPGTDSVPGRIGA